ncbi:hypothetical protein [Kitasatospora kifunensis]|uniref:Uncharacterized protein n=1 Tax=Kitasatospora kifunensis TaxID=58351 RepID=A0A7W7RBR1_KITKI|nr:hypothetical protein [Kitasatospora kifunensis]MBB4929042.1 hypothetical protein [Kitasatospora kifunensis]
MKTDNGRRLANREELVEHSGYSLPFINQLWRDRATNGHPEARVVDGVMHWDIEQWDKWFEGYRKEHQSERDLSRVNRDGDPSELLPPAKQARVLGVDPARITQYEQNPPPHWPAPAETVELPTRTRNLRTRQQLWDWVDNPKSGFGTTGGHATWRKGTVLAKKTKAPDPRIALAAAALAELPEKKPGEVAVILSERHGQAVNTWKSIITKARKQPTQ